MRQVFTTVILIFISITCIQAQKTIAQEAREKISSNGQVEIKFTETNLLKLKDVSKKISIDDYKNGEVTAFLSRLQIDDFLQFGYDFTIQEQNRAINALNVATSVAQMSSWDRYPSYDVYMQMMQDYATNFPNLCRLDTIGLSPNGRQNVVLKITDNPDIDENEPEFFYSGQMHGDEIVSGAMFLRLIDYILNNYSSDSEISDLVNNVEIWINPVSNLDGMYYGGNDNVSNSIRYAANGVDLNRNFPNPVDGDHPDGNPWAQENIDMMAFCDAHDFVMSANSHSGAEVINYPWDSWTSGVKIAADDNWWQFVSNEYADIAQAIAPPGYLTDVDASGITNGGDWYVVTGSRQDYVNYYHHCREVTLELSSNKLLDSDLLPDHWLYNKDAMIAYLKQVQYGINGIITDDCTGNPIKAKVEVQGHDMDNSFVYSSLPIGNFHRPIYAGTYTVIVSADGYQPQTFNNISVSNYATTGLNVSLTPLTPVAAFSYDLVDACLGTYTLTNNTAGDANYQWNFPGGGQSTNTDETITFTENGTYSIQLDATNTCSGSNSISQDIVVNHLISTPNTTDVERCGSGNVTFSASANGAGTISWFDAENGNLLSSNTSYTTNITQNTTVWVEETGANVTIYGAKTDNSGAGGYYTNNSQHALIFDCTEEVTLKSVKVYANGAGNREITLLDGGSNTVYQQTFNLPDGESRVNLDWTVPVGVDYYLYGPNSPNLFRNGSGTSADLPYPYNIDNKISIKWNTADDQGYYYYFYDWEIESIGCSSPQVPVNATVNPLAIAGYSFSQTGAEISFTNTSVDGTSYAWDFGDGNSSTLENPIHEFTANGDYLVTLTVTNDCGPVDYSETITITGVSVNEVSSSKFAVYPNPTQGIFTIKNSNSIASKVSIEIISITGELVLEKEYHESEININIDSWSQGSYFIKLTSEKETIFKKIVKL